jgi:hypothetical protein
MGVKHINLAITVDVLQLVYVDFHVILVLDAIVGVK